MLSISCISQLNGDHKCALIIGVGHQILHFILGHHQDVLEHWVLDPSLPLPRPAIEDFDGYLPRKCRRLLSSSGMYRKEVINGKVRVTGGKKLKASGAYSKKFGQKAASLFKKNRGKVS